MKWLIMNTEAFSPPGLKKAKKKILELSDLPWVVQKFLSVFPKPFIILDEASKIKTNTPMYEDAKSLRTRNIKQLNQFGERCIMTGTLKSKSPLNVMDPFEFLKEGFFPENMWEFAERYTIMETIFIGRVRRRVTISEDTYKAVRNQLRNAWIRGGEAQLKAAKESIFKAHAIDYVKQEHIIRNRKYTPFINQDELMQRISPVSMVVRRKDVFDIKFDHFVTNPIMRPVELTGRGREIAKELVEIGFTDSFALGKAPALELLLRIQDVCNGFEPIEHFEKVTVNGELVEKRVIEHKQLPESPKLDALMTLLEEINVEDNQVVVWCSRTLLIETCAAAFEKAGYSYVLYNGKVSAKEKTAAEKAFKEQRVQIFLGNPASGAYGLNCLAQCSYAVYICIDDSVEVYHQSSLRIVRGQLTAPKFIYHIYTKGTVEERQQTRLKVGRELIGDSNTRELFEIA